MSLGLCVVIWIIAGIICVGLISMAADNHRFVVRRYTAESAKVSHKLTFVFVSDLHSKVYGKENSPLLDAIDRIHPDAVLAGGDMIISRQARKNVENWWKVSADFLSALCRKYPVYLADGNHENYLKEEEEFLPRYRFYNEMLEKMGVHLLHNRSADFGEVRISGLELPHETYQKIVPYHMEEGMIEQCIGTCDPERFTILLAHNPKFFPEYACWGADLTASGHVHGGLLRIGKKGFIGPDLHLFPKYSGGEYRIGNHVMVLSCGLGSHTLPVRIFNPGELSVIEIKPEK